MSRKTAPVPHEAAPEAAPAPLPQSGGAWRVVDGALVSDEDTDPPTRMPGADRAATSR